MFPGISVTGDWCALKCKHCNAKFLKGMIPCTNDRELVEIAGKIANEGGRGILLSGGCNDKGMVPLWNVLEGVHTLKKYTALKVNAHTGLVFTRDLADLYVASGIDVFSVDVVGSKDVVREILHLGVDTSVYTKTIENLLAAGGKVVPHITIGVNYGKESGEEKSIEIVAEYSLPKVVLNVLVPVSGTALESVHVPYERIEKVFEYARGKIGGEIVLGCMRERIPDIEKLAYRCGLSGIAHPSREFIEFIEKMGGKLEFIEGCCSLF